MELPDSRQVRVARLYPKTVLKPTVRTMLVPVPRATPGQRPSAPAPPGAPLLRDQELLAWCAQLVEAVFGEDRPAVPAGPAAPAEQTGQAGQDRQARRAGSDA